MRFRLLMSYHDLTLQDIAQRTGAAVSTVGTWKNGRIPSSPEVVQALADTFNVSVDFLMEGRARGSASPDIEHASKILRDIDDLLRELGEDDFIREPQARFETESNEGEAHDSQDRVTRTRIETYFSRYLDQAEQHPDGLSFTWIQMLKDFPLDMYMRLK